MRITKIQPWVVEIPQWDDNPGGQERRAPRPRQFVFVQVDTDEGITGWGEVTTYPGPVANRAVAAFIGEIGEWLKGEDPENIEMIWAKIFRGMTYVGTRGATTAAISGIDIALWDILGKSLGKPIYKLLGGAVRDRIALYTHPPEPRSPADIAVSAKEIKNAGYRAFKMDPMMSHLHVGNASFLDGEISAEVVAKAAETTAAAREAVGPEMEILIDAHGMYNVPSAVKLANALEPYGIFWFEEPVPVESWKALKQVKEEVNVRISVGERLHTRWEFVPIFENNLADFVMPDVTWTGGITELKKITTMAEAYYIPMSPHDASGPVNILAGAHVMMTCPNFYKLETSRWNLSGYNVFIDKPLDIRSGDLYLDPNAPGLGIELDVDFLRAHALPGFGG
jgi:galactonate dehydratase